MALSNSQYDAIMREYGRQQLENQHQLEARRNEIYRVIPAVRELEAEIAGRSVAEQRPLLGRGYGSVCELREELADLREQKAILIRAKGYPEDYLTLHYRCPDCRGYRLAPGPQMSLLSQGSDEAALCPVQSGSCAGSGKFFQIIV